MEVMESKAMCDKTCLNYSGIFCISCKDKSHYRDLSQAPIWLQKKVEFLRKADRVE